MAARIRTVKPELFRHEELHQAELDTGLPLRLAFIGLFTVADREGRFRWQPRQLKLDIMPYDLIDFSRVLDALATRGFLVRYACGTGDYGVIPTFTRHQVINNRERASDLPSLDDDVQVFEYNLNEFNGMPTRRPRVDHASTTRHGNVQGEGKGTGRELEGEQEGNGLHPVVASTAKPSRPKSEKPKTELQEASAKTWASYASAYFNRYHTEPVRNQTTNSQIAAMVKRVGIDDAPAVAAYYVGMNKRFYVEKLHPVGVLLVDCEAIRTQWATNRQVTSTRAGQMDQTQTNFDLVNETLALMRPQEVPNDY